MNSKKIAIGFAAILIALLLIVLSIPRIKKNQNSENKPAEATSTSAPNAAPAPPSVDPAAKPAPKGIQSEPPAVLPMPGAPPPIPQKKK